MKLLTASQWFNSGYLIRRGERSYSRDYYGRALFSRMQVRLMKPRYGVVHIHHYH